MNTRLFQFRLRSLLLTVAIVAFVCWWIRWPRSTAIHFLKGDAVVAPKYLLPQSDHEGFRSVVRQASSDIVLTSHPRSFYDVVFARSEFIAKPKEGEGYRFWVERGKIVGGPTPILPTYYYGSWRLQLDIF